MDKPFPLAPHLLRVVRVRAGIRSVIFVESVGEHESESVVGLQGIDVCVNIYEHVHPVRNGSGGETSD